MTEGKEHIKGQFHEIFYPYFSCLKHFISVYYELFKTNFRELFGFHEDNRLQSSKFTEP